MTTYQIRITLRDIKPAIWRRFEVAGDSTLFQLHQIILVVMGWTGCHMHAFWIQGKEYGPPDPEYAEDGQIGDEKETVLQKVISKEGETFEYVYDFGDDWEHKLVVEKISSGDRKAKYPHCIDGARACPPEDCGGAPGYEALLETIAGPKHEDHEELRAWVGEEFDPERFVVDEVNEALGSLEPDYGDVVFD